MEMISCMLNVQVDNGSYIVDPATVPPAVVYVAY